VCGGAFAESQSQAAFFHPHHTSQPTGGPIKTIPRDCLETSASALNRLMLWVAMQAERRERLDVAAPTFRGPSHPADDAGVADESKMKEV